MNFDDPEWYLSREIGALRFQSRVLNEAADARNPLLERVKALFYFTNNTDEFFMKRIGRFKREVAAGVTQTSIDGKTSKEHWEETTDLFRHDLATQYRVWREDLLPALGDAGIHLIPYGWLSDAEKAEVRSSFASEIMPTLTPLAFDPGHPFPFLSNLSLSVGMWVTPTQGNGEPVFTRVKVPTNRPAYVVVDRGDGEWYGVSLSDVIMGNLDLLVPSCEIESVSLFRITRSAEVDFDEDDRDEIPDYIRDLLEERRRAGAVRLEVDTAMPESMRSLLLEQLGLAKSDLIEHPGLVDFLGVSMLGDIDRPDLKYSSWSPLQHPQLIDEQGLEANVFTRIRERDILLHHPYYSFAHTTQQFLDQAAADDKVLGIKIAIYRTDNDSKVLNALIRAAQKGKQVAVLVELKARFDEGHNLKWVSVLEEQGIHVAYGIQGQKAHTKIALVIREEEGEVRLYSHIGTGNYHSGTAKGYTDLALLTANREIGSDLVKVFNIFTGPHRFDQFDRLLVAPLQMRSIFQEHIEKEAALAREGKPARIVAKMNALEHPEMVRSLYEAAQAGVEIDLIVRDICRLRPGIEGASERVRVHSLVGRFLEHSRIFYFGNGDEAPAYYIGSADWMRRNLDNRTEAVTPLIDPLHQRELKTILETLLADNRRRWTMDSVGNYSQQLPVEGEPVIDAQEVLMRRALKGEIGEHGELKEAIESRQMLPRLK